MGQPCERLSDDRDCYSERHLQQEQVSHYERQGIAGATGDQSAIGREDAILPGASRILQRVHKRLSTEFAQRKEFASRVPGYTEGHVYAVQTKI